MTVPFRVIRSSSALVLLIASLIWLAGARSSRTRLIDTRGTQISSIFYGAHPNPRFASELQRSLSARAMGAPPGSCKVVAGVYHPSRDNPRLVKVQGGTCFGHYFPCHSRICGGSCGGLEFWCYTSPDNPWYQGYEYVPGDCDCACCTDEDSCFNGSGS